MPTTEIAIIFIIGSLTLLAFVLFIVLILVEYRRKQVRHITEKLELEHRYNSELLRTQVEVQEQSFRYISEEIHDNIAQMLSLVKLKLYKMAGRTGDAQLLDTLHTSTTLLGRTLEDLRALSHTLNGQLISRIPLTESLEKELQYIRDEDLSATLEVSGTPYEIDAGKKLLAFRIVQEAINNAIRHGKAQHIQLRLAYSRHQLAIVISDDGLGFDTQLLDSSQNLGLQNMQLRAQMLGSLHIVSGNGCGTTITLNIYSNDRYNKNSPGR